MSTGPTDPAQSGLQKDPSNWATGDEPPTPSQLSYLQTLANETDTEVPQDLTKAKASELIDQLRGKSSRVDDDGS